MSAYVRNSRKECADLVAGQVVLTAENKSAKEIAAYAGDDDDDKGCRGPRLKPIPGGGAPYKPFGVPVHYNPLSPTTSLADISDPSQITDFDGFYLASLTPRIRYCSKAIGIRLG